MKKKANSAQLWEKHGAALRNPHEIFAGSFSASGITEESLDYSADHLFVTTLKRLGITLLVSREYENLVLALNASSGNLSQTFFHLPHPAGIAVSKDGTVHIAATRNPNQIIEFKPARTPLSRAKAGAPAPASTLMPTRSAYLAGSYYLHDLARIGNKLYGNAVGLNSVVEIDMDAADAKIVWWPKSIEKNGKPRTEMNHMQLNSIAAGNTLRNSYFSASGDRIISKKPGDPAYPVDKKGVIFSGATREPIAYGLTRPHSARLHKNKIYVANSGYGEVGVIEKGAFVPGVRLKGWTRGLCIVGDTLFVGTSRILPRFHAYAPGVDPKKALSGIHAISLKDWSLIGSITFPHGNQIFAIEAVPANLSHGFLYSRLSDAGDRERAAFATYQTRNHGKKR